ncbi:MAG TPA: FRG domain-containing protein [Myxococcales bacterium]|jgi:hypothetical protein
MARIIRCSNAEELLDALAPISKYFRSINSNNSLLLFRGCGDATWRLLPSTLRQARGRTLKHQVRLETDALIRFLSECDEHGLPIPNDSEALRRQALELNAFFAQPPHSLDQAGITWPTDAWLGLMALAQHNGLPTRLLDWTSIPFVAAYFAALPNHTLPEDSDLAVWALTPLDAEIDGRVENPRIVRFSQAPRTVSKMTWMRGWQGYALVDTTRAGNSNLIAQRGFLTAHVLGSVPDEMWNAPWNEAPLDELLESWDTPEAPRLRKFVLERRHAPAVLEYLKHYGISTAAMFPGYGGIARSVLEMPKRGPHDP